MLRIVALALMLSPGIAHAQKFVSVDDPDTATTETTTAGTTDPVATSETSGDDVAEIDYAALGDSIVLDGATAAEIETLLNTSESGALAADEQNAIITRVETDADGGSVLALDVASSGTSGSQETAGTDVSEHELGECNEGTNWVSDDINCYNAYPTASE